MQMEASKVWGEDNKRWKLFISHFYDCEMCWGKGMTAAGLSACHAGYREHYEFAHCRFQRWVGCSQLACYNTHGALPQFEVPRAMLTAVSCEEACALSTD